MTAFHIALWVVVIIIALRAAWFLFWVLCLAVLGGIATLREKRILRRMKRQHEAKRKQIAENKQKYAID